ncbi:hypothetical protein SAMN05444159_5904 [Bradyrhizobium lablabi]|uniref:Methylaspartate ammonia-lyase n=2 Tax=Bradyrhizobium lablabi TaxID=722472 RepID=A0A1M7AM68_9BRAD|nr:hypothetical protein [Bradyrhizobium lablabi]SHL43882.1 hypothetical protein SAMN05444159_5904 [Bradyrhizobium lablabi]
MKRSLVTILCIATMSSSAAAGGGPELRQTRYCAPLADAVTSQAAGANAVFVRSYEHGENESSLPAGLASTAFVYDNALAVIALVACGNVPSATIIGNALSLAARNDRSFPDGRIRNAYRAGPAGEGAPALPGWWDDKQKIWAEDPAQDGTSTGNVAWAALALLTLHQATKQESFLADAEHLIDWVIANVSSGSGFRGGFHGYDPQQVPLTWISTEHNVDVYAAATWLFRLTGEQKYADAASQARRFLDRAFDADHFLLGTKPDGSLADSGMLALDVQLWPWMAVLDAPARWRSALNFAATHLAVKDGFDFNGDRDGLWVEGTAQASLAYRIAGDPHRSAQLLTTLEAERTPSGLLNATREARVSTGLSIDPTGTGKEADFFYFRRPHLGATAWVTLAALGWNPFTGRKVN